MRTKPDLFSVIDVGSNSVRMVVFDTAVSPPLQLYNEKTFCALGRDIARTGRLSPEGVEAALGALRLYADEARKYGKVHLDVVGTAALRDAEDGPDFIERCRSEIGLSVRLIDGHQEARYAALGVLSLNPRAEGLVADFGGGSLEFACIRNKTITDTISKPYGAFRALAMDEKAAEIIGKGLSTMGNRYMDAPALHSIGGSWRSIAQAFIVDQGAEAVLQGYAIDAVDIIAFCDKIIGLSPQQLQERYRMEDKRSALAGISAVVLKQVFISLRPKKMIVSQAGIRDGIVYDFYNG